MEALEQTTLSWPEAVVAIIALIWYGLAIVIIQLLITRRARMTAAREKQYRQLAEEAIHNQQNLKETLNKLSEELKKYTLYPHSTAKTKK